LPFYLDPPTKELRFGDIVTGFQYPTVRINTPDSSVDLRITVSKPQYFVVMTPCCDIELQAFSLAPLDQIRDAIVMKQRLRENLLMVNVKFKPKDGFTPEEIGRMDGPKQAELASLPEAFSFQDCFIYEPNGLFAPYDVKRKGQTVASLQHRMVDFKSIFRVGCSMIDRAQELPAGIKISELSVETRAQLREKLAFYFGRPATEDEA
jgi:hypothetical protein